MADQNPIPVPGTAQHYPPPDAPAVLESNVYSDAEPSRNPHLRRVRCAATEVSSSRRGPNTPGAAVPPCLFLKSPSISHNAPWRRPLRDDESIATSTGTSPPAGRSRRRNDEEMGGFAPRYVATNDSARRIDWSSLTRDERAEVMRLPWTQWMNSEVKNHFVASMGEFVGTTMFLFFAFAGTEVANIQSNVTDSGGSDSNTTTGETTGFDVGVLMYISVAFGFSLMVNMLGGLISSVMVRYLFPENFNVRTTLGGGASLVQGVFIEAILTAELVFTIFMLAKEKHRATFIAPVGIGLALFIAELVGVQFTGGSLNPARSFGPCVVTATFDKEHWIYWVGPLIGSLIAVVFYKFIKMLEYEMVSPGADGDPTNDPTKNPEKRAEVAFSRSLTNAAKV
ncbi:aquaporin-1 [Verticillium alfalfae VaMs.102]|uniref:Aquaporin-1 n=1 Tax=Verticillium alfalfae (strain VaMs.102 / ATCC MYA-4576 / FGSC 10136) TaxID=526221 RepID=C9SLH4_VERA1|nr:aquaporin-1 [Verticillium alfalfae VaMs.102]EEY19542.1 aquaporin-1 [Verticillium alfalfae VaMs.102]